MNRIELYIDGHEIELDSGSSIAIDYALADVNSLGSRSGNASLDFSIPATKHNRHVLEFSDKDIVNISNNRRLVRKYLPAEVRQNGVSVLNGTAQLTQGKEINGVLYYIASLVEGNADWWSMLTGKNLSDLQMPELEHEYNIAEIKNSWEFTEPYVYPLIRHGAYLDDYGPDDPMAVRDWIPAIKASYIMDKIISGTGFRIAPGGFFSFGTGSRLIVPVAKNNWGHTAEWATNRRVWVTSDATNSYPVPPGGAPKVIVFNNIVEQGPNASWDFSFDRYSSDEDMELYLTMRVTGLQGDDEAEFAAYVNGVVVPGATFTVTGLTVGFVQTAVINFEGITLAAGDYLEMKFRGKNSGGSDKFASFSGAGLTITPHTYYVQGSILEPQTMIPTMTQSGFVASLFQSFGLYVRTDFFRKLVYFETADQFFGNDPIVNGLDWTDKLEFGQETTYDDLTPANSLGRKTMFKWEQDDNEPEIELYNNAVFTLPNAGESMYYGDGVAEFDNDFIEAETTIAESVFASTWMGYSFENKLHLPFINLTTFDGSVILFTGNPMPRLLIYGGKLQANGLSNGLIDHITFDGLVFDIPYAYFWKLDYTDPTMPGNRDYIQSLCFEQPITVAMPTIEVQADITGAPDTGLIEEYNRRMLDFAFNGRMRTCWLWLNAVDIANLDFRKPVYIDHFKSWYYINRINDYEPGMVRPTYVELLRI